jgi:glutamate synthase (NADPH/NADH) small chain
MDFLKNQNQIIDEKIDMHSSLNAKNKNVIVIGGGDTGSDCIGTSNRQGAKSVVNFEILPKPPKHRSKENPWPYWPFTLKSSSSHEEGSKRKWSILTKEFISDKNGKLTGLKTIEVELKKIDGQKSRMVEIDGTEKIWPCDMVLLALGFTGPEKNIYSGLNLKTDEFNKPLTKNYMTSNKKVFAAGDLRRGQSLIVWAISEGREAAYRIDEYLMGYSNLPSKIKGDLPLVK